MKLLFLIPIMLLLAFKSNNIKPPTVEDCIEMAYNSAAAYDHATTPAQRTAAQNQLTGVKNPLDFNDPDLQTKVEAFLATKMDINCVGAAAVCYMQFLECWKRTTCGSHGETGCPPGIWCYTQMSACMGAHCGIPL